MAEDFAIYTPLFNLTGFPALRCPAASVVTGCPLASN